MDRGWPWTQKIDQFVLFSKLEFVLPLWFYEFFGGLWGRKKIDWTLIWHHLTQKTCNSVKLIDALNSTWIKLCRVGLWGQPYKTQSTGDLRHLRTFYLWIHFFTFAKMIQIDNFSFSPFYPWIQDTRKLTVQLDLVICDS
jgi:hypothetical protein